MASARNPLIFIFITRLIDAIGFGIVLPVLPDLLVHIGPMTLPEATRIGGLLGGTYALLQFFCGPLMGNLSDRFGRRPVILLSLAAFAADYAVMGFAPTVGLLFLGRAIAGIAGGVYAPANSFIADITAPEERAQMFGRIGAAFGVGFILGPMIGGWMGAEFGPRAPFFAAAALAGANCLFGYFVLPESLPLERRRPFSLARANPLGTLLALKKYPMVTGMIFAVLVWQTAQNVYPSSWAFYCAENFHWNTGMIGVSFMTTGIGMAVVQFGATGWVVARLGEARTAIVGISIAALACLCYAFIRDGWMIFAVQPWAAFQAIAYPAITALMSREVAPDQQGELQGGVAGVSSLAQIAGPFVMTQTLAAFTSDGAPLYFPGAAFLLSAALMGICLILLAAQLKLHARPAVEPA
jgi:DHA1 family tetracycline resistance protein-like MFS transporter